MAILLFKMRHVPDDEAEDIRELLHSNDITFYETTTGTWRISLPGIWLPDDRQLRLAQQLLDDYQQQRLESARQQYEHLRASGQHRTLLSIIRDNPLQALLYWGLIILVIYLSLQWFLGY